MRKVLLRTIRQNTKKIIEKNARINHIRQLMPYLTGNLSINGNQYHIRTKIEIITLSENQKGYI